ncbi:MAG: PEGA domain-containing protein [Phycisphaerales bacterium JB043]
MRRTLALILVVLLCTGCVERRIFITSEPSGALVHVNDVQVGRTPLEVEYTYHGVYDVRLQLEGHEPLSTSAKTRVRTHDLPLIDLVAAALPFRFRSNSEWHFELTPSQQDPDELVDRAREFRDAQLPDTPARDPIADDQDSD